MSKLLMLGLSLADVIEKTTAAPARALGRPASLGALAPGREADISVLDVVEGEWLLADSFGRRAKGRQAIVPVLTVRAGEPITPAWGPHPWGRLPEAARQQSGAARLLPGEARPLRQLRTAVDELEL